SSTDVSAQVSAVAGKRFISELEASLLELESQGWTLSGTPDVVLVRITSRDRNTTPPTVTIEACIDSSDVHTLDSNGDPLPTDPSSARALNSYVLSQQDNGTWLITSHSFPPDPSC